MEKKLFRVCSFLKCININVDVIELQALFDQSLLVKQFEFVQECLDPLLRSLENGNKSPTKSEEPVESGEETLKIHVFLQFTF